MQEFEDRDKGKTIVKNLEISIEKHFFGDNFPMMLSITSRKTFGSRSD